MTKNKTRFDEETILKDEEKLLEHYQKRKRGTFKTIFEIYKGNYKNLAISAIMFFIKDSPVWIMPLVTATVIDIATEKPANAAAKLIVCAILTVLILAQNIPTHTLFASYLSRAQRSVEAALRGAMIRKLQQLSIPFHKKNETGKIHSKIMRDVEAVEGFTNQLFSTALTVIANMLITLIIVMSKSITVFLMFLLSVPIAVLITKFFKSRMQKQSHDLRKNMENASSNVVDMESLIPVTRAHALENYEIKKMTASITRIAESGYKLDKTSAIFGSINWVVFSLFQMICLFFTGSLALKGKISIGDISLYQSYFAALIGHVSRIVGILPIITKGAESISSIGEILYSNEIEDNENKLTLASLKGSFEFEDIHFQYDRNTTVLDGFSLKVNQGETVALVGESGSGKTTVLNLVIGFNKIDSGVFKIDGINSDDINMRSYRSFISVVPQASILFSGSIRDNITYGKDDISEEALNEVIKAARLESVIEKLPDGIDTLVGERGSKLSGGQSQRISIARAIIRNPRVIIFDEATSALDSITEKEIQEAIENLTKGRTTFIVAHRLSTVRNADKIAVMQNGKCVEFGTYDELMALKGEFYKLKQMQT